MREQEAGSRRDQKHFPFVIGEFKFEVQQSDSCCWHQPGGLADSSRWLKRSENHRNKSEKSCTPKGCENLKKNLLHTPRIWHPVGVRSVTLP